MATKVHHTMSMMWIPKQRQKACDDLPSLNGKYTEGEVLDIVGLLVSRTANRVNDPDHHHLSTESLEDGRNNNPTSTGQLY